MRKSVWLLSAGLSVLTTPAFAQDTSEVPPGTQPSPTEQASVEPEGQAAAEVGPGEIIITAQGRVRDTVYYSLLAAEWPSVRDRLDARLAADGRENERERG